MNAELMHMNGAVAALQEAELDRMVEAILFAVAEPVTVGAIRDRIGEDCDVQASLRRLGEHYASRGVRVVRVGDAWAIRTAPDLGHLMTHEKYVPRKLSRAALETLAIIAYHQPATRAEIEEIRGVSVSKGSLDQLIELNWVGIGRRRRTPGRPVTFVVTRHFLDHFGLESLSDLPGLKELRESGLLNRTPPEGFEGPPDSVPAQDRGAALPHHPRPALGS